MCSRCKIFAKTKESVLKFGSNIFEDLDTDKPHHGECMTEIQCMVFMLGASQWAFGYIVYPASAGVISEIDFQKVTYIFIMCSGSGELQLAVIGSLRLMLVTCW